MRLNYRQIPNAISISRIPAAFAFLLANDPHDPIYFWTSMCIVGFAFLTDILDGYLARFWNVESTTGYFLDGIGDKVFAVAVLLVISREHPSQLYLAWVLIVREIILYALRALDTEQDRNIGSLRIFSLTQVICLRLYFLGFFVESAHLVHEIPSPPYLSFYYALGYASAFSGCVSIILLSKRIIGKELSP